jgi:ABC-type transport system involved in cytochrome c biogenesis permease subunit
MIPVGVIFALLALVVMALCLTLAYFSVDNRDPEATQRWQAEAMRRAGDRPKGRVWR